MGPSAIRETLFCAERYLLSKLSRFPVFSNQPHHLQHQQPHQTTYISLKMRSFSFFILAIHLAATAAAAVSRKSYSTHTRDLLMLTSSIVSDELPSLLGSRSRLLSVRHPHELHRWCLRARSSRQRPRVSSTTKLAGPALGLTLLAFA